MSSAPSSPRPDASDPTSAGGRGGVRRSIEHASLPLLTRLAKLPVWLPFLVVLVLLVGGGVLGGVLGGLLVALALLAVLWLLFLSWPQLTTVDKVMRIAILVLFLSVTATRLFPNP